MPGPVLLERTSRRAPKASRLVLISSRLIVPLVLYAPHVLLVIWPSLDLPRTGNWPLLTADLDTSGIDFYLGLNNSLAFLAYRMDLVLAMAKLAPSESTTRIGIWL